MKKAITLVAILLFTTICKGDRRIDSSLLNKNIIYNISNVGNINNCCGSRKSIKKSTKQVYDSTLITIRKLDSLILLMSLNTKGTKFNPNFDTCNCAATLRKPISCNCDSILSLIKSIIASLAWPVAIIFIALILKKNLLELLKRINKIKYKDAEFSFILSEAILDAKTADLKIDKAENIFGNNFDDLIRVAKILPSSAIPIAWISIESSMTELIKKSGLAPDFDIKFSPYKNLQFLLSNQLIDNESYQLIDKLRRLRNQIAHSEIDEESIKLNDAMEYIRLSNAVVEKLKNTSAK